MKISVVPPNRYNPSEVKVEHKGDLYLISRKLKPNETVDGVSELLKSGQIQGYGKSGDTVTFYASSDKVAEQIASLRKVDERNVVVDKLKEILLPPNLSENTAPEYLKYRMWSLASTVAAGAVNFANIKVGLDASKETFGSDTARAAWAQTINTYAWRFSSLGSSFLAFNGDVDPRRFATISSMISSTTALSMLGILSVMPKGYMPVNLGINIAGALGSSLGGAANANVFNHLTKKNRGVVSAKNSNQELVANMIGMPIALGMRHVAQKFGINSALLTAATMSPLMFYCSIKAISCLRMEPIDRTQLENNADLYLKTGTLNQAPTHGWVDTLKGVFGKNEGSFSPNIKVADNLDGVIGSQDPKKLFSVYKDEKYILSYDKGNGSVQFALRKDAGIEDIFKAYTQARLVEQAAPKLLAEIEKIVGGDGQLALAELALRALDKPMPGQHDFIDAGWHANQLKLHFPVVDSQWKGDTLPPKPDVTVDEIYAQMANPDNAKLSQMLGVTPAVRKAA